MEEKIKKQLCIVKGIVKKDNKYLLTRRERAWDKSTHNKWEFPGGKIDFGEDPSNTASREVKEESGYDVETIKPISHISSQIWTHENKITQIILIPFLCKFIGGEPNTNDKNINNVSWFTKEEIKTLDTLSGIKEILPYLD